MHAATSVNGPWREAFGSKTVILTAAHLAHLMSTLCELRVAFPQARKQKRQNVDGDNLDDGTTIYAISAPTHGQDDTQVTEEQQEMDNQRKLMWTMDTE